MSDNVPSPNGKDKRAALPKHLEKLDVVLEREKSVRAKQGDAVHIGSSKPSNKKPSKAAADAAGKYEVAGSSSSGSNTNAKAASTESSSGHEREKGPSKQRNAINKVAVAAVQEPSAAAATKRPASAPVANASANKASIAVKPGRNSVVIAPPISDPSPTTQDAKNEKQSSASKQDTEEQMPRMTAANSRAPEVRFDAKGGERTEVDDDEPAKGMYYDLFIQTRRCEELCCSLGLTLKHIRAMKKKYDDNDMYCTGEVTQDEFFFMINEEKRPISKGIFKFGGIAPDQKYISFDQYILCVVHFASLTKPELFQYVFDLYDDDRSGSLDDREFTHMSKELQSAQFCFSKNVDTAIKMLGGTDSGHDAAIDDGLVDLPQFMKFVRNFPVAFYPIVNMQKNVRAATLGESFWSRIVARRLKIQELVTYMRRNNGAVPEMTVWEHISSVFYDDVYHIRKRAGELYALEVMQRKKLGWTE